MVFETFDMGDVVLDARRATHLREAYVIARAYPSPRDWLLFMGVHGNGMTNGAASRTPAGTTVSRDHWHRRRTARLSRAAP